MGRRQTTTGVAISLRFACAAATLIAIMRVDQHAGAPMDVTHHFQVADRQVGRPEKLSRLSTQLGASDRPVAEIPTLPPASRLRRNDRTLGRSGCWRQDINRRTQARRDLGDFHGARVEEARQHVVPVEPTIVRRRGPMALTVPSKDIARNCRWARQDTLPLGRTRATAAET